MSALISAATNPLRAALVDATAALLDEAAAAPERRAILCEKYVDNLLGTLQLTGALALKDCSRSATLPLERNLSC